MSIEKNSSLALQGIANTIENKLKRATGERLGFVLIVAAGFTSQYVSNCSRLDGKNMIESLLERWRQNKADIPGHYNPDLTYPHETLRKARAALEVANGLDPSPTYQEAIADIDETIRKQTT